jgi:glutamine synthetase
MDGIGSAGIEGQEQRARLSGEAADQLTAQGFRAVQILFIDPYGVPRAKLVTTEHFRQSAREGHPFGIVLVASNLWQQRSPDEDQFGDATGYPNGLLLPDLATLKPAPWAPATAIVIADLLTDTGQAVAAPRQVLKDALAGLAELDVVPVFGTELEFYLYSPGPGPGDLTPLTQRIDWFSAMSLSLARKFITTLLTTADAMELSLYEVSSEAGAGQFEANLEPGAGLKAIDDAVALKIAIKETALSLGLRATFMAKPTASDTTLTSGYHLHQSAVDGRGTRLFGDPAGTAGMSDLALAYIAGQLRHARAMTALAAPTVTAYKRYAGGAAGPCRIAWGVDNRTALIRALPGGASARIENRLGSADANPYLLAAAMTAAGCAGLQERLVPPPLAAGNVKADTRRAVLPRTLGEAIEAFEADQTFTARLGKEFSAMYARLLWFDWYRFAAHVTDWEISEYRDVL